MLTMRNWVMPLLRTLQHEPRPLSTVIPPRVDASQPIEEERTPYYDPSSFYPAELGEVLNGRYQITTKLGYGSSSRERERQNRADERFQGEEMGRASFRTWKVSQSKRLI
jgi:hypothetical protein